MKKYITYIVMLIPLFMGCDTGNNGMGFSKNFIDSYLIPNEIFTWIPVLKIEFLRWHGIMTDTTITEWADFKTYSEKYGDTHYNRNKAQPIVVIADPLTSISIVSDKDYDELHPAGTPLDDVAVLFAFSPYKFIQNDYKDDEDEVPNWMYEYNEYYTVGGTHGFKRIFKYLNELTQEDMTLLDVHSFQIIFPENNPVSGEIHNLTVTIVYQGRELVTTHEYEFL